MEYYIHVDELLPNTEKVINIFSEVRDQLKMKSDRYSKILFAAPLSTVSNILEQAHTIRQELLKENPDYNLVNELAKNVSDLHWKQYTYMGVIASHTLRKNNGFVLNALLVMCKVWNKSKYYEEMNDFHYQELFAEALPLGYKTFMELFHIDRFDIMTGIGLKDEEPVEIDDMADEAPFNQIPTRQKTGSLDSLKSLVSEEETEFVWLEAADFEKFESVWKTVNVMDNSKACGTEHEDIANDGDKEDGDNDE